MNKKQLCEHIGNIDDRLVAQAEKLPHYRQLHRRKIFRRFVTAAAAFLLMACSFSAGAFAFAHETVVKVPAEQETVTLEDIHLTLILPDNWNGKYSIEKDGRNYIFYHTQTRKSNDNGILFYIVCHEEVMTPEQFEKNGYDFVGYHYLFATSDKTYILYNVSDVQWDTENPDLEAEYRQMEVQVSDIRFIVEDVFRTDDVQKDTTLTLREKSGAAVTGYLHTVPWQ